MNCILNCLSKVLKEGFSSTKIACQNEPIHSLDDPSFVLYRFIKTKLRRKIDKSLFIFGSIYSSKTYELY